MREFYIVIFTIVCLAIGITSCNNSESNSRLSEAESLMQEHPDSALLILESIDQTDLKSDADKALYGLLYTMSLDKTYRAIDTDSLIAISVEYFRKTSNKERQAASLYYHGRYKYLNGHHPAALVLYLRAMELSEELDNKFYMGLSSRGISDIYSESFNAVEELVYAKKEHEYFKESACQPYMNYSLLDLTRAYLNNQDYSKVYETVQELTDSACSYNDSYLFENGFRLAAIAYIGDNQYEKALDNYSILCENGLSNAEDSLYMVLSYVRTGNTHLADSILNTTICDNAALQVFTAYHVNKLQGNVQEALFHIEKLDSIANFNFKNRIDLGLTTSVSDYYQFVNKQSKEELEASKMLMRLSSIIGLMIFGIIVLIVLYLIIRQKNKIHDKVIFAEQLEEMLQQSKADNEMAEQTIKHLTAKQYKLLEDLCEIVSRSPDSKNARKKIADSVTNLINNLSINGNKVDELGKVADFTFGNIYSDLKKDLPNLKEADYCLYLFAILGFSNISISLFLKEDKVSAVYDRKRRLKDKIKLLEKEKSERYLRHLN